MKRALALVALVAVMIAFALFLRPQRQKQSPPSPPATLAPVPEITPTPAPAPEPSVPTPVKQEPPTSIKRPSAGTPRYDLTPIYLEEAGCDLLQCAEQCYMARVYSVASGTPATWSYCTEAPPLRDGPPDGWVMLPEAPG